MNDSESPRKLQEYIIRPKSLDPYRVRELQDRVNKQLADKKLLKECALINSNVPVTMITVHPAIPALKICCTRELAILITNMKDVFRLEPEQGQSQ